MGGTITKEQESIYRPTTLTLAPLPTSRRFYICGSFSLKPQGADWACGQWRAS